jgi:uncharacterized membrane protein YeaQ/YmgE (transglycosylase-associated protein family)
MSYDLVGALRERYFIPATTVTGLVAKTLQGPSGKKGLVRDIIASVTTTIVGTTSVPEVRVGTASSDNSFARFLLGTTATAGYAAGVFRARSLCQNAPLRFGNFPTALNDFANHIFLEGNNTSGTASLPGTSNGQTFVFLPADTAFFITITAAVGAAAGVVDTYVDIDWF